MFVLLDGSSQDLGCFKQNPALGSIYAAVEAAPDLLWLKHF